MNEGICRGIICLKKSNVLSLIWMERSILGMNYSIHQRFLKKYEETGREYYFFTNNSSKSQRAYIEKLGKLGIPIKKDQMMISSHVIIKYLKEHYDGKSIYVLGTPSLIQEFQYFDMNLTDEDPDIRSLRIRYNLNL